jgi:hypothetical protein
MGRVTAISCMVGAPLWRSGAPALAALDPDETGRREGGADRYLALLARWIGAARHGDLLSAQDPIREARGNEYRVLSSGGAFADLLAQAGLGLAPLSRMPPVA